MATATNKPASATKVADKKKSKAVAKRRTVKQLLSIAQKRKDKYEALLDKVNSDILRYNKRILKTTSKKQMEELKSRWISGETLSDKEESDLKAYMS